MSSAHDQSEQSDRRTETMGGLVKGLAILEMFSTGSRQLTVAEAARGANITRAAARRCLLTLADLGYLEHDGKFFSPRPRLWRLGGQANRTESLAERAQPILEDVSDKLRESVSVAILDGRDSLFVARAEIARMVSTGVRLGAKLPAYCSATGRLLLGILDDREILDYLRGSSLRQLTEHTVTDPDELLNIIRQIRDAGVSYNDEELELGMRSLAVAVYGPDREVIAAMSVSASSARVTLDQMKSEYLPIMQEGAARLSRSLAND